MSIKDLIEKEDFDFISFRLVLSAEEDIFAGAAMSEKGKLISLDGDVYSESAKIIKSERWTNEEENIKNGITVWVEEF